VARAGYSWQLPARSTGYRAARAELADALYRVTEREKPEIGVLISLESPTKPMEKEAASAGLCDSPFGRKYPRLQSVTAGELLAGKETEYPRTLDVTFKRAWGAAAKSIV